MNEKCPVCMASMSRGLEEWHGICHSCGYESASFNPEINSESVHFQVNEDSREVGIKEIRARNFDLLIKGIRRYKNGGRLLDVRCAHGWLLARADNYFEVTGIEPDGTVNDISQKRGGLI